MSLVDMKGQVALITGSSRGIGKAIAEAMAGQGAKVVIASRKQDACDAVAAELNAKHGAGTAVAVAANISSKENLQHLVDETVAAFGQVTALVCNAASNPDYGPSAGSSDEQLDRKSGVEGKRVRHGVDVGGRGSSKKKTKNKQ